MEILSKINLQLFVQVKASSVKRSYTVHGNGIAMKFGGIAFIGIPAILREMIMNTFHISIPVGFCQYGCRSNGCVDPISLNDAMMIKVFKGRKPVAIN